MSYESKIAELPKPHSLKEQYLYALVCHIAGVVCETPYQSPTWREDQYWKAFAEIAEERVNAPVVPGYQTVGTDALIDQSVVAQKIKDNCITPLQLAEEVTNLLLGDGAVESHHIADGAITQEKLGEDVTAHFVYDGELNDESENAPQTKAVKAYVDQVIASIEDISEEEL